MIPQVEKTYPVQRRIVTRAPSRGFPWAAPNRFYTGLNALDRFAWIGAFSSGGLADDFETRISRAGLPSQRCQLRLLWIACGTDDRLIDINRKFRDWLTSKDIKHVDIETPGAHTWMVWRRNLAEFAALLFR